MPLVEWSKIDNIVDPEDCYNHSEPFNTYVLQNFGLERMDDKLYGNDHSSKYLIVDEKKFVKYCLEFK